MIEAASEELAKAINNSVQVCTSFSRNCAVKFANMKVLLFITGLAGLSLATTSSSAQTMATGVISSQYINQAATTSAPDAQEQALAYYAAETPATSESKPAPKEAKATKTMSEELTVWVENKQAVMNSYKRPKRRKAQPPVW